MRTDTIALCYPNRIELASLSSPTAFAAELPITNLQDPVFNHWARRVGVDPLQINGTFSKQYFLGCLAIAAHNLSGAATWRARLYSTTADVGSNTNVVYDSSIQRVWPSLYTFGQIPWGFDNWWSGGARDEDRGNFTPLSVAVTDSVLARGFTIDIEDADNPDGYLQVGRVMVSDLWQPTYNYSFGSEQGYDFRADSESALDDTEYIERISSRRLLNFTLEGMAQADAQGRSFDVMRMLGTDGELLVLPNQDSGIYQSQQTFIGRLQQINPLKTVNYDWHEHAYSIKEKT